MMFPLAAQGNTVSRHRIQAEAIIAKGYAVRFFLDEMDRSVFIDEAHRNHIVALTQHALGDVVAPRGILIVRATYLLAIQIGIVSIEERAQQQSGWLAGMLLVDGHMLPKPDATHDAPAAFLCPLVVILVNQRPAAIIIIGRCKLMDDTRVFLVQQFIPALISKLVGTLLSPHHLVVLIEAGPFHKHGIVLLQRVGRDPSLDGSASPAVDDDALRNVGLLLHPLTQEITYGREEPGILLRHRFPVDGCGADIVLHTMRARLVLYSEQAYLAVLIVVDLLCVPRIDTLDGHVDV